MGLPGSLRHGLEKTAPGEPPLRVHTSQAQAPMALYRTHQPGVVKSQYTPSRHAFPTGGNAYHLGTTEGQCEQSRTWRVPAGWVGKVCLCRRTGHVTHGIGPRDAVSAGASCVMRFAHHF